MNRQPQLQKIFENIVQNNGKVYFQPPSNLRMIFPCIEYHLSMIDTTFADDSAYHSERRYQVTTISPNPENPWIEELLKLPKCTFSRHFTSDGLNHDVFYIYF